MKLNYVRNFVEDDVKEEYTMHLYSSIGMGGISGQEFVHELNYIASLEEVKTIHIRLNSPGGSVLEGLGIVSAILECPKTVITYTDGIVASIATQIFLAGDITCMRDTALLMLHNCAGGNSATLDKFNQLLNKLYVKRTGATAEQIKTWMDAETYFSSDEAKEYGLTDQVFETEVKVKKEAIIKNAANVDALYALYVQNLATEVGNEYHDIKIKNDEMIENKLKEVLNLDVEMTPEQVIEHVQNALVQIAIVNDLQDAKAKLETEVANYVTEVANYVAEIETVKNQLVEKDTEITNLTATVDAKEATVIELTNKVTEFVADEVKRKEEKVNTLITNAIEDKKIAPADKQEWYEIAVENYDRAEKLINGLTRTRTKLSDRMNAGEIQNTVSPFDEAINKIKNKDKKSQ